jgi:putative oxidoreductase
MNSTLRALRRLYTLFASIADGARSPFLLLVRLYWGWQFTQTGWGKLHHLTQVTEFFTSLGLPAPGATAIFVACVEFFGGLLLIAGLGSRLAGLVLTGNMLVAYITADREALLSVISNPGKFYSADPYTFLFAALLVLILGSGWFAADTWIGRFLQRVEHVDALSDGAAGHAQAAGTVAANR